MSFHNPLTLSVSSLYLLLSLTPMVWSQSASQPKAPIEVLSFDLGTGKSPLGWVDLESTVDLSTKTKLLPGVKDR